MESEKLKEDLRTADPLPSFYRGQNGSPEKSNDLPTGLGSLFSEEKPNSKSFDDKASTAPL